MQAFLEDEKDCCRDQGKKLEKTAVYLAQFLQKQIAEALNKQYNVKIG